MKFIKATQIKCHNMLYTVPAYPLYEKEIFINIDNITYVEQEKVEPVISIGKYSDEIDCLLITFSHGKTIYIKETLEEFNNLIK